MKKFLRYLYRKINPPAKPLTSEDFVKSLNERGAKVGTHTHFFAPAQVTIDMQRPWLLEIGDYCKITQGVVILAHDYSRSVLRRVYGEVIGEAGKTKIGDNVFIGINSIILMGSHIGNNVIIGAGSVVNGNIPDNVVAAGNPAKVIYSLGEYYAKRKAKYVDEAKLCAREYYLAYGKAPSVTEMNAFFPLYLERKEESLKSVNTHLSGDDENDIIENFMRSELLYPSFEDFLKDALGGLRDDDRK